MFGLGTPELIVILGIAFLIFGGKKLPEIGSSIGKTIGSFKKEVDDVKAGGKSLVDDIPGVKEVAEVKEQIDKVKNISTITK